jgi:hypothetical protein
MAIIETRGYVNKYERKTAASGAEYSKFTLAVQQKRKDKNKQEVVEKLYFNCVDFSGKEPPNLAPNDRGELSAYVGIKGYLTITGWCKDGKGGANLDVTITEYEAIEPKGGAKPAAKVATAAPPADPFALDS